MASSHRPIIRLLRPQPMCCGTCCYLGPPGQEGTAGFCTLHAVEIVEDAALHVCFGYVRDPTRGEVWRKLENNG